jgi:UDP-2,3-diacylglucosamine hydrolase
MRRLFISDLHLSPARPELIQLSCDFINSQAKSIDELYILGDIFNTWLGDDLIPAEFSSFVSQLQLLSANGIKVFLMVGNRDFMLGKQFAQLVGGTLIEDGYRLKLGQQDTLLMHGDSLCTDDISYQRYRRVVRNRLLQWCFLHLPASFRQGISDKIIATSKQKKQYKAAMIMDVNQAEVGKVIEASNIDLLIHGHTHRPAIHTVMKRNGIHAHRIVLGDWGDEVSYLLSDDAQLSLHDHRVNTADSQLRLV